jgi:protein-S-isoprenylcysteine O-methyltransferase Ste14
MSDRLSIARVLIQALISFFLLIVCYFYFDPFNTLKVEADAINMAVSGLFIPIIYSITTIIICTLIGLPLHVNVRFRTWWSTHQPLQFVLLFIAAGLLFLSLNENFRIDQSIEENGRTLVKTYSNTVISLSGWFLAAFILLHARISVPDGIFSKHNWTKRPDR